MRGMIYQCGSCPYLPDREFHAFHPGPEPPPAAYRSLMDQRFRRSGSHLYMPLCPGCNACQPVRVDVASFSPRADQRRCARRHHDLVVTWQPRGLDDERRDLFTRYQAKVHGKAPGEDPASFLVDDGGVAGGELHARDAQGRLMAVSVIDTFPDALSSVYCYYDPDSERSGLGTFMILREIAYAQGSQRRWLYLGFLVRGCTKMEYKARFRPQEVLEDGAWVRYE